MMENVAATQLPSIQKRRFATAFQAKDIENAQKQAVPAKTENATKWAIRTWNAWAEQRVISVEEQQLSCITDLLAIKIEEMSEQQLIYFVPRFILEEYPPNSLYQMVCGIQRQIQKKKKPIYSAPPILTSAKLSRL